MAGDRCTSTDPSDLALNTWANDSGERRAVSGPFAPQLMSR